MNRDNDNSMPLADGRPLASCEQSAQVDEAIRRAALGVVMRTWGCLCADCRVRVEAILREHLGDIKRDAARYAWVRANVYIAETRDVAWDLNLSRCSIDAWIDAELASRQRAASGINVSNETEDA